MPQPQPGALKFFPHFVRGVTDDPRLGRVVAKYGHEGYYFCYRLKEIVCETPEGHLVLAGRPDQEYVAYQMRLEVDRFLELLEAATSSGWFSRDEWLTNYAVTSQDIREQIEYARKMKTQKREWWQKNRGKESKA